MLLNGNSSLLDSDLFVPSNPPLSILGDTSPMQEIDEKELHFFLNSQQLSESIKVNDIKPPIKDEDINDSIKQEKLKNEEEIKRNKEINNVQKENKPQIVVENLPEKKYKIKTDSTCAIILPENYSTDDAEEQSLVNLMNRKCDIDLETIIEVRDIKVYTKFYKEETTLLLLGIYEVPYPIDVVYKAATDPKARKKYSKGPSTDETIISSKKLSDNLTEEETYVLVHVPFPMTNRDLVLKKKRWDNYAGKEKAILVHVKNHQHEKYPEKSSPIRGKCITAGMYFEKINDNVTKYVNITHNDMKMPKALASMMQKTIPQNSKNFLKEFAKGCEYVIQK